jgi:hypothetical protein
VAGEREALEEVAGCFEAAESEGLSAVLTETTDELLKDLIERRRRYSRHTSAAALGQPAEEGDKV